MMGMDITVIFTVGLALIAILFDIYIIAKKGNGHSISKLVITTCYKYPFISFGLGYLLGHLTWQMPCGGM